MSSSNKTVFFFGLVLAALVLPGCGERSGADGDGVPRRYAWPRIALEADTAGTARSLGDISLRVNGRAAWTVTDSAAAWADLVYSPGVRTHLSVTHPQSLDEALANRHQRMSLNLGGAPAMTETFVNPEGWQCQIVTVSGGAVSTTPVQFVAVNPERGLLLNGASVIDAPGTRADSIAPVVEVLHSDALTLLKKLGDD